MAGLDIPATVQGKSLVTVLDGRQKEVYPHVVCYFRDKQRMIRTDRWKLIHYPHIDRWQLFDLTNDPAEMKNLADDPEQRAVVADLRAKLTAWQKRAGDALVAEK